MRFGSCGDSRGRRSECAEGDQKPRRRAGEYMKTLRPVFAANPGLGVTNLMDGVTTYVIVHFGHLMTADERRAHRHLLSSLPLTGAEQRLKDGIAWEEARGNVLPEDVRSIMVKRRSGLSNDPEILRLASGGLEAFLERTAKRIFDEDREHIFLNNCPSCGALARTPQAKQCRFCGHDWHDGQTDRARK